jgi:hypothetical protein
VTEETVAKTATGDRVLVGGIFAAVGLIGLIQPIVAIPWLVAAWVLVSVRESLAPHRDVAIVATVVACVVVAAKVALIAFT